MGCGVATLAQRWSRRDMLAVQRQRKKIIPAKGFNLFKITFAFFSRI